VTVSFYRYNNTYNDVHDGIGCVRSYEIIRDLYVVYSGWLWREEAGISNCTQCPVENVPVACFVNKLTGSMTPWTYISEHVCRHEHCQVCEEQKRSVRVHSCLDNIARDLLAGSGCEWKDTTPSYLFPVASATCRRRGVILTVRGCAEEYLEGRELETRSVKQWVYVHDHVGRCIHWGDEIK
jgi:hypothetical protein